MTNLLSSCSSLLSVTYRLGGNIGDDIDHWLLEVHILESDLHLICRRLHQAAMERRPKSTEIEGNREMSVNMTFPSTSRLVRQCFLERHPEYIVGHLRDREVNSARSNLLCLKHPGRMINSTDCSTDDHLERLYYS